MRERRLQAAGDQGGNFGSANAATSGGRGVQFALAASSVPPEMVPTAETMDKLDAYLDNMSDSLANAVTSGHLDKSELVSLAASLSISEANCATLAATNANLVKALAC